MKCSIIIPYSNRKPLLINTLRFLNKQDFDAKEFEIILIEDGSKDFDQKSIDNLGFEITIRYFKSDKNLIVGSSATRNIGIKKARGKIIIFLDCDMITQPNFVRMHYEFHKSLPKGISAIQVGLRKMLFQKDYSNQFPKFCSLKENEDYEYEGRHYIFQRYSENLASYRSAWFFVFTNNISVQKKTIEQYGTFDEGFSGWGLEDNEFGYRLSKNGVKVLFNPNIEAYHQYHGREYTKAKAEGWNINLKYLLKKYDHIPIVTLKLLSINQRKYIENLDTQSREKEIECNRNFFTLLEETLRIYHPIPNYPNHLTLKNPSLPNLKTLWIKNKKTQFIVICKKTNIELIIWIQLNSTDSRILLYTI